MEDILKLVQICQSYYKIKVVTPYVIVDTVCVIRSTNKYDADDDDDDDDDL